MGSTGDCGNGKAAAGGGGGDGGLVVPEIKFTKLFINGQFVDAASGNT